MRTLGPLSALVLLLAFAAPAAAQQPPPAEQRIAPGVKAGGLDVGGLTVNEAAAKLQQTYGPPLYNPISVQVAGRRFRLTPKESGLKFDTILTAKRAYHAGVANPAVDVPLATSLSKARVRTFARGVAKEVYLAPRDATIRITLRHIFRRKSQTGRSLDVKALRAAITLTLSNATAPHVIRPERKILKAKVTADKLARAYPTVVTIDRNNFKLRLFKRLKFSRSYGVAVGQPAYPTPAGRFQISNKQVNPAWTAPNSPWAGELAGTTTPGGSASNPLRARWMGIAGGVGIHGTSQEYSIGSRASHGCIRMRVADVIDLYSRVPVGTPVLIR
ncbi:MAG TPA: L,D-transpeptidase family protein [Solirubrobacteraceae bacterium]|nr:L,D-transpeptidase family protein [Solirubrobacteraceae bacterium]